MIDGPNFYTAHFYEQIPQNPTTENNTIRSNTTIVCADFSLEEGLLAFVRQIILWRTFRPLLLPWPFMWINAWLKSITVRCYIKNSTVQRLLCSFFFLDCGLFRNNYHDLNRYINLVVLVLTAAMIYWCHFCSFQSKISKWCLKSSVGLTLQIRKGAYFPRPIAVAATAIFCNNSACHFVFLELLNL